MKSLKILIPILVLILLSSCTDRQKIKNKIDGKYTISKYEGKWTNYLGCNGTSDVDVFSIDNPGKLVFTGKKVIDGTSASPSERPYYGYFEYEYATTNAFGNAISATGKKYFQYDVLETTGSVDTVSAFIYIDELEYDLSYTLEGNKITSFTYNTLSGCYRKVETHYVQ